MLRFILGLQRSRKLEPPLILQFRDSKERCAHNTDDDRRQQGEHTLPDVLCARPGILPETVECSDHAAADDEADKKRYSGAVPYLYGN